MSRHHGLRSSSARRRRTVSRDSAWCSSTGPWRRSEVQHPTLRRSGGLEQAWQTSKAISRIVCAPLPGAPPRSAPSPDYLRQSAVSFDTPSSSNRRAARGLRSSLTSASAASRTRGRPLAARSNKHISADYNVTVALPGPVRNSTLPESAQRPALFGMKGIEDASVDRCPMGQFEAAIAAVKLRGARRARRTGARSRPSSGGSTTAPSGARSRRSRATGTMPTCVSAAGGKRRVGQDHGACGGRGRAETGVRVHRARARAHQKAAGARPNNRHVESAIQSQTRRQ